MFLDKLRIMNLWKSGPVELNFDKQVTVLTGINGSGKSSILNIIYDSLHLINSNNIQTSKNRLWASECSLNNKVQVQTLMLPPISDAKQNIIHNIIVDNGGTLFTKETIKEVIASYKDKLTDHISFSKGSQDGEGVVQILRIPSNMSQTKAESIRESLYKRPNAFLFQEDRKVMHNMENSNIDPNLDFWDTYSSSIDTRFFYIRDAMQIRESQIDAERSRFIDKYEENGDLASLKENQEYKMILMKKKSIADLFNLLNGYFFDAGKQIVKDKGDNKITLKHISSDGHISWHLLSRGEKTLIYLFFATFLYKDKVPLFLFDEPDVALHVKWQECLLKDLVQIAPKCQFIIATHSPSLVMKGWMDNCLTIKVS